MNVNSINGYRKSENMVNSYGKDMQEKAINKERQLHKMEKTRG